MGAYTVGHRYRAVYRNQAVQFDEGATVEVDDDLAVWVNNDSPGVLVPADEAPEPEAVDGATVEVDDDRPKRGRRAG